MNEEQVPDIEMERIGATRHPALGMGGTGPRQIVAEPNHFDHKIQSISSCNRIDQFQWWSGFLFPPYYSNKGWIRRI